MSDYNYYEAVTDDVKEYIKNEINLTEWKGRADELEEKLNEDLWLDDSVTGNGSGSYTFNTWQAEENLAHNLDLLEEALDEFGCDKDYLFTKGAESADVTIRCYLLSSVISKVLEELEEELEEDEEE